jgi:hypothetical protein
MSQANLRRVVLVTGLITAVVHGVLLSVQFGEPSVLFILNGLGYLVLVVAFVGLPESFLNKQMRVEISARMIRIGPSGTTVRVALHYAFIAFTALTILAWIPNGSRTITGFATKLDELILIYALFAHLRAVSAGSGRQSAASGS